MVGLPRSRLTQNPLLVISVAFALGILAGRYISLNPRLVTIVSAVGTVIIGLVVVHCVRAKRFLAASALIATSFVPAGFMLSMAANRISDPSRIKNMFDAGTLQLNEPVEFIGTIKSPPEVAPSGFYLTVQVENMCVQETDLPAKGTVLLLAPIGDAKTNLEYERLELRYGARIRVMTVLAREDDFRNPGVMPFTEYLDRKDYDATGLIKSPLLIERLDDARVFLPLAWLYEWRTQLQNQFDVMFSPETAGVLAAALLGNRYGLSRGAADRFRSGGTFHVLVISGLHISFIGGLVLMLVRWLTKQRLWQFAIAATFLWAYTLAVGAEAPVVRAALMFTLVIFAPIVWRRANSLSVIGATVIALLAGRPNDLFDPSFQLTFLSVLSIVVLAVPIMGRMQAVGQWHPTHETPYPPYCPNWFRKLSEALFWSEITWQVEMKSSNIRYRLFKTAMAARLERLRLQRLLRFAATAVVVSVSVQVGMLPVLIIYFHRISFASLFLNIFVGAAMALLSLLALAAILISQISPAVQVPLVWLAEKIEWLMVHAVDPFSRFGLASARVPHYHGWATTVYVLYFALLLALVLALARWNPLRPAFREQSNGLFPRPLLTKAAVGSFAWLGLLVIFHPLAAVPADGKLHVDFLDVGQGDSALVTMPDGATLLIDGGGQPNFELPRSDDPDAERSFERDTQSIGERVVSEYLWSRGLDRIDYILATHADADHIDGLNDVARNFKVCTAIVARTPLQDPEYARFATTMKDAGVRIEDIGAGDVLKFGSINLDVLWPPARTDPNAASGNNDSIVLRLRYGEQTLLFAADIEKPAETAVLNAGYDLRADILKVAHHGSRTSSTERFVAATRPMLAIISVGRTSIFGHPHKEVVDRWRASGTRVMTTGEKGTISVVTDGKEISVKSYLPSELFHHWR
jgi:competence protein ComEC